MLVGNVNCHSKTFYKHVGVRNLLAVLFRYPYPTCRNPEASAVAMEKQNKRPAATPCRSGWGEDLGDVPDITDTTVQKPQPGKLRVSREALERRLHRIFLPNVKGEFKVSQEIITQWKSKRGKRSLQKLFETCGYNPDWFGKRQP